jgi:lysozyme
MPLGYLVHVFIMRIIVSLIDDIKKYEGFRGFPYMDTTNHVTIGYGRNLENGISMIEADYLLKNDIENCQRQLSSYIWYYTQKQEVRDALVNMCFNLGFEGFMSFKKMILALIKKDYKLAAQEALNSRWASQVGQRALDIATIISHGGDSESGANSTG